MAIAIAGASGSARKMAMTADESRITSADLSRRTTFPHDRPSGKAPLGERRTPSRSSGVAPPIRLFPPREPGLASLGLPYLQPPSCSPLSAVPTFGPADEFAHS